MNRIASLLVVLVLAGCVGGRTESLRFAAATGLAILNAYTDAVIIAQTPEERAELRVVLLDVDGIVDDVKAAIALKIALIDSLPQPPPPTP